MSDYYIQRLVSTRDRISRSLAGPYKYFKVKYYSLITESVAVTTTNCYLVSPLYRNDRHVSKNSLHFCFVYSLNTKQLIHLHIKFFLFQLDIILHGPAIILTIL